MTKPHKLAQWLRHGGEAQLRRSAVSEIFEVEGLERKRSSAAGHKTIVRPLLDARLNLTPQQRATGNAYGGFLERLVSAGGSEWIREYVDGGQVASGGTVIHQMAGLVMIRVARQTLEIMPPLRHRTGPPRKAKPGPHKPIPVMSIVDQVCVWGRSVDFIAITHGWFVMRGQRVIVPTRQRKAIVSALIDGLDAIGDAWQENGQTIPASLSMIEVE